MKVQLLRRVDADLVRIVNWSEEWFIHANSAMQQANAPTFGSDIEELVRVDAGYFWSKLASIALKGTNIIASEAINLS